jgi:hypothetical protein
MVSGLDANDAQMLLDELAGVMATQSIKTSPERWFRAVLDRFHRGRFAPSAGLAAKEKRLRIQSTPVQTASPEVTRHYLERIQTMLGRKGPPSNDFSAAEPPPDCDLALWRPGCLLRQLGANGARARDPESESTARIRLERGERWRLPARC